MPSGEPVSPLGPHRLMDGLRMTSRSDLCRVIERRIVVDGTTTHCRDAAAHRPTMVGRAARREGPPLAKIPRPSLTACRRAQPQRLESPSRVENYPRPTSSRPLDGSPHPHPEPDTAAPSGRPTHPHLIPEGLPPVHPNPRTPQLSINPISSLSQSGPPDFPIAIISCLSELP